jgi:DNA primase small subunit
MGVEAFLRKKFREYYLNSFINSVSEIDKREFGIGFFGQKISQRHLSFSSLNELNSFLKRETPFFISYSTAYYEFPSARPMDAKKLLKADIVYEFDSDDIKTPCKEKHDSWQCKCGANGKGIVEECSKCGEKVKVEEWVCLDCLKAVKKQLFRLISFLENDFGFTNGIELNFSGSKGFHLHLKNKEIQFLSNNARIELLDFLTANGLSLEFLGFERKGKTFILPKLETAKGWSKKILIALIELFENPDPEKIAVMGKTTFRNAQKIVQQKEKIVNSIKKGFLLPLLSNSERFWNSIISEIIDDLKLDLDRQTSADLKKLIRVPDTIHGSTGLIAKRLSLDELKDFNPLNEAIVFSTNPIKIFVERAPKFFLGGSHFGPFKREEVELPEFAAVFLMARGVANAINL